ncbi:MAG: hypothetical protein K0Q57_608 [Gammaproteobacteria bacterium]|jgi:hypothetical protein|nr:hypothetical protein [Gammaproteobacteria bacterium]
MNGLSNGLLDNYNCSDPANIYQPECDGDNTLAWKLGFGIGVPVFFGTLCFCIWQPICKAIRNELKPKTDPGLELSFNGAESKATPFLQAANDNEAKGKPLAVVVPEQPNPFDDD